MNIAHTAIVRTVLPQASPIASGTEPIAACTVAFGRYEKAESNKLQAGNVLIDLDASRVYIGKEEIVFTALEYKILVLLFSNMGKTVTRENILDKIWDVAGNFVNDNTLTVYVKRIRAKLGENDVIKTIKGIGYRVEK